MSTDALNLALAGLDVTRSRIDTLTRNISNAQTEGYVRKVDSQTVGALGTVELGPVRRAVDESLRNALNSTTATQNQLQVTVDLLGKIESVFGTPSANTSLSSKIVDLQNAFQNLAADPEKSALYGSVIDAANGVTQSLHDLTQVVTDTNADVQGQLQLDVTTFNQSLAALNDINKRIVAHSGNEDITDLQDQRDRLISTLSGLMDITTFTKPSGEIAVYTSNGKPLVDLGIVSTVSLGGATGLIWNSPPSAPAPIKVNTGTMAGLLNLQNTTLPGIQAQLDDIARALTVEFNAINVPLFYEPGVMPFNPASVTGYAGVIAVNPTVTQSVIHDGAAPALALVSGPVLAPGDTTFIDQAVALFNRTNVAFTAATGLPATGNIAQVATDFISRQSVQRANAEDTLNSEKSLQQILKNKLSAASGVNIDDEVAQLTVLQNAYSANARVLQASRDMFTTLFNAVQ
jgi:flagellar hook-associated protein 1 FlgK